MPLNPYSTSRGFFFVSFRELLKRIEPSSSDAIGNRASWSAYLSNALEVVIDGIHSWTKRKTETELFSDRVLQMASTHTRHVDSHAAQRSVDWRPRWILGRSLLKNHSCTSKCWMDSWESHLLERDNISWAREKLNYDLKRLLFIVQCINNKLINNCGYQ